MFTSVMKGKCELHNYGTLELLFVLAKTVILKKVLLENSFPMKWANVF